MKYIKALFSRIYEIAVQWPLAVAAAVFIIVGAIIVSFSGRNIQIGGLLSSIFKIKGKTNPDIRVITPNDRDPIVPGESDDIGYVQSPGSMKIIEPGLFSDPSTIRIIHPEKGEIILPLPVGVKNEDVSEVIEVASDTYQIKNNDKGVDTSEIRNFLR